MQLAACIPDTLVPGELLRGYAVPDEPNVQLCSRVIRAGGGGAGIQIDSKRVKVGCQP